MTPLYPPVYITKDCISSTSADIINHGITTKAVNSSTYASHMLESPDIFLGTMYYIRLLRSVMVLTTTANVFPIGYRFTIKPNMDQLAKLMLYNS